MTLTVLFLENFCFSFKKQMLSIKNNQVSMFLKLNITDNWFVRQCSFNSMGCVELNSGMIVGDELEVM
jgi:hypothetical protein